MTLKDEVSRLIWGALLVFMGLSTMIIIGELIIKYQLLEYLFMVGAFLLVSYCVGVILLDVWSWYFGFRR